VSFCDILLVFLDKLIHDAQNTEHNNWQFTNTRLSFFPPSVSFCDILLVFLDKLIHDARNTEHNNWQFTNTSLSFFPPISVISSMFHNHNNLYAAVTRRANPGNLKKISVLRESESNV
jgi:hypothetical protein